MFTWLFTRKATVVINNKKVKITWDCRRYNKHQAINMTKQQIELGIL